MRISTSLLALTAILTPLTSAFTCYPGTNQTLAMCCGAYYAYGPPPSPEGLTFAIMCSSATVLNSTTAEYSCASATPGCCAELETREAMAFDCLPGVEATVSRRKFRA